VPTPTETAMLNTIAISSDAGDHGVSRRKKKRGRLSDHHQSDAAARSLNRAVFRRRRDHDDATGGTVISGDARSRFPFQHYDGLSFLRAYPFTGAELVYCDPPYMHETRGRTDLYRYEMDDWQHAPLPDIIERLPCPVMLSGYWTERYAAALQHWNSVTFETLTRAGRIATEWLWFNFPEPVALHNYRYLGEDFRERERIKRKQKRWVNRLHIMPTLERRALLAAIGEPWQLAPAEPRMVDAATRSIAGTGDSGGRPRQN
jgi:hypothetical protein